MTESMRSRGMRDVLPDQMERFRRIEDAFRAVCRGWGYEEVRTPTIEHLFLFTSAGTLSPQMLDRVYSFLDWDGWSGERVVLRPDSTIPAVRLFEESMQDRNAGRLFYVQNVFRFEQGNESREDWQCGVELLGDTSPHGDIELILVAIEVLRRLGVEAQIQLSHPGILRALLGFSDGHVYDALLGGDTGPLEEALFEAPNANAVFGALSVEGEGPAYLENLRAVVGAESPAIPALDQLAAVSTVVDDLGLPHRINPLAVRNFEYYTGPVFTLTHDGARIGGGGRYDSLAELIGGRAVPASGFALEVERLATHLGSPREALPTVSIHHESPADLVTAFELAREIRGRIAGARVIVGGERSSCDVVVSAGGIVLTRNGASPQKFEDVESALAALAESLAPGV